MSDQVREACELLWWDRLELQRRAGLPATAVDRILASQGEVDASPAERAALGEAFHRAGLEFTLRGGVRMGRDEL